MAVVRDFLKGGEGEGEGEDVGRKEQQDARGMDKLLAILGATYKLKNPDMVNVAQKLEQLEMVIDTTQEDGITHLL